MLIAKSLKTLKSSSHLYKIVSAKSVEY